MGHGARTRVAWSLALSLASGLGASADEPSPSASKRSPDTKPGVERAQPSTEDGGVRVKEITKVSRFASVVLDKHCPDLVQPYTLTDNLASLGAFALKQGVEKIGDGVANLFRGSTAVPASVAKIPASTKLAAKQLNWLPMRAEVAYGESAHREETNVLERGSRLGRTHYPPADGMLRGLLATLHETHEYDFKLFILKNSTRNAVARPGGFLYLDQGLVDDPKQHPKAHFALAHEVAHVLQRHETKDLQSMVVDSISSTEDLTKTMWAVRSDPTVILTRVKARKNLFTRHHIDQELQADSCAVRLLSRFFANRQDLANSLQAFLKDLPAAEPTRPIRPPQSDAEKLTASVHDIVDTPIKRHPTSQERYQNLRTIYDEMVKGAPKNPR